MKTHKKFALGIILFIGFLSITFSGPNWHIAIAAWLSPIFLLYFLRQTKTVGFLLFIFVEIIANAINHSCLVLVDIFVLHIINGISYGILFSLPYLFDRLFYKQKQGFYTTLIFPSALVLTEYLFSLIYGIMGSSAITQYSLNNLTQIVSVTGLFGLTFLIAWMGSTLNWIIENEFSLISVKKGVIVYGSILILIFIYGDARLSFKTTPTKTVKVASISSEIDIHELFKAEYQTFMDYKNRLVSEIPERIYTEKQIIENQIENTLTAAENDAKIIVWNEISLILNTKQVDSLKVKIQNIAKKHKAYILMAYLEENSSTLPLPFNNKSVLIEPDGTIAWEYRKSNLEPQLEAQIANKGNFKIPFIDTPYGRIGNVICYDFDFLDYIREASKNNIDIMMAPSYDWKEFTPLHANMASLQAIMNGFSFIRPNGKGHSVIVDYYGNIISQMNTFSTDNKIIYGNIPAKSKSTVYAKTGDVLVYLCIIILVGGIILSIRRKKRKIRIE